VGYGWRVANVFPEIPNLLASNRDVIFTEALKPEEAINTGVSILQSIYTDPINIKLSADFYHTRFLNQIFPDYDSDSRLAILENFTGKSVSNSFQADVMMEIMGWVEFKTSYNYLDVYRVENGQKKQLPFNAKHRIITAINVHPLDRKWAADLNLHWFSEQRLPNTSMNPPEYQRPDFSESFATVNAQFSYYFPKFELYVGCENIFDFRQTQPIISSEDPFGPYFDTSSVWGPTRGREFYLGFRFFLSRQGSSL
jgi:outer membrane receptor protein involved in Fe transport